MPYSPGGRLTRIGNGAQVERLFKLWAEGRVDEGRPLFDPEIEWLEPPDTIGRHVVTGPDAALEALANWSAQFGAIRAETTEMQERDDRVLHAMKQYARPHGTDVEIEGDLYMVWWFRDGRATRMEMYNTRAEAEAAFERQI